MEKLLKSLGIDENADAGEIVGKLELKQSEIMERLDNVEDEARRQKLEEELKQIEAAIAAFSWMKGKGQTGIAREEEEETEDFSDLKGQEEEQKTDGESYKEALGLLGTPDYAKGVETIQSLAEKGYADVQNQLGIMYRGGIGVSRDILKAIDWFQKAAEQGYAPAQTNLGDEYYSGKSIDQNYYTAARWYQKAAEQGNADAQYKYGLLLEQGNGVVKDTSQAARWYQKAAEQGNTDAQCSLAGLYDKGDGIAQDRSKALKLYKESAENGNVHAQSILGWKYYNGAEGVALDKVKAAELFKKAAKKGDCAALCHLGEMLYRGEVVERNPLEAIKCFLKSAKDGNLKAKCNLIEMYCNGYKKEIEARLSIGTKIDDMAFSVYSWAWDGNMRAQYVMGLYEEGRGDKRTAKRLYQRSAAQGYEPAKEKLKRKKLFGF